VFGAYHLYRISYYSQARRPRGNPVVVVPKNSEVTIARRVMLRASIHEALAIVNFRCVRGHSRLVWYQGTDDHDFVVLRTEWPKARSLINHGAEILYFYVE
jgi:hypothetical protein